MPETINIFNQMPHHYKKIVIITINFQLIVLLLNDNQIVVEHHFHAP